MRISNHIKSAAGKLSQHKQLSHDLMTTLDFGQLVPVMSIPLLPRDKFKINAGCFARVAPMIFPTYGQCEVVTNFHSVQYSQVWQDFDLFVTGQFKKGTHSISLPCIKLSYLNALFLNSAYSYSGSADADNHDIVVINNDLSLGYRNLTLFGRYVRKVLSSLGYPFITTVWSSFPEEYDSVFSALPLMSFLKVYCDFYESRQYTQTSLLREILHQCFSGVVDGSTSYFNSGSPSSIEGVNVRFFNSLQILFENIRLLYTSDYVTSAQAYPNLVGGSSGLNIFGSTTPVNGREVYQTNSISQQDFQNVYYSQVESSAGSSLGVSSQASSMHRILDNFENLVRRFNLVGSREIDRIRSLFGLRPSFQSNYYSTFHGGFSSPLQVQDVTSTSAEPSVDNYLGSYAGKGIVGNGHTVQVDSDDFGILIGLSFIKVKPLYVPGLNREVLKTSYFSYYNPEFDHGYSMAVAEGEVQSFETNVNPENPTLLTQVFGYQNAYDDYRMCLSRVNGDFLDEDLLSWSFVRKNIGRVAQSNNVIYFNQPSTSPDADMYSEFQRIFVDGSGRDHFYLSYGFNIDALRVVRTSSECFDLGVGNVSTSNNPVI